MSSVSFTPLSLDPAATCEDCGATGAFRFATATLCTDCYQQRGACCAERIDREKALSARVEPTAREDFSLDLSCRGRLRPPLS